MATVTENEKKVLEVIHGAMKTYEDNGEPGFSDVMLEDITDGTGLAVNTVKGLLGSLEKKGFVDYSDVNDEYNVYYITQEGRNAL